jgi:radical SAM superfamily enzyme YgiQ (UPF0313 family)
LSFVYPTSEENRNGTVILISRKIEYVFPMGYAYLAGYLLEQGEPVEMMFRPAKFEMKRGFVNEVIAKKPVLVAFGGLFPEMEELREWLELFKDRTFPIVIGGQMVSPTPELAMEKISADFGVIGEGEITLHKLVKAIRTGLDITQIGGLIIRTEEGLIKTGKGTIIEDLSKLPKIPFYLFPEQNWLPIGKWYSRHFSNVHWHYTDRVIPVHGGRGCPFRCLSGDTLIDTTFGKKKIKDLVGLHPKVLTRDLVTKEPIYAQSSIVAKTGENEQLVRVHFKEGGHIDCTPDHRFITFKNGNQHCETRESETEAKELKRGQSVRAIHYDKSGYAEYIDIVWGRRKRIRQHSLILESMLGRKLKKGEWTHHIDHNVKNNVESNLLLTNKHDHTSLCHPEVSQRMKDNNPANNLPHEFFVSIGQLNRGKIRTMEARLRYRESKMGVKNPNYKQGYLTNKRTRIPEVNHIVESVVPIEGLHDTYCLEVPGYDWFYANEVLVHNCNFCYHHSRPRFRPIPDMIAEAKSTLETYNGNFLYFGDDLTIGTVERANQLVEELTKNKIKLPYHISTRFDILMKLGDDLLARMKESGCRIIGLGVESGSDRILKIIGKNCTHEDILTQFRRLNKVGILPTVSIMVGQYTETKEDVEQSIKLMQTAVRENPNIAFAFTVTTPFPGSKLYDQLFKEGLVKDEQEYYNKYFFGKSKVGDWNQIVNLSAMGDKEVIDMYNRITKIYKKEKRAALGYKLTISDTIIRMVFLACHFLPRRWNPEKRLEWLEQLRLKMHGVK